MKPRTLFNRILKRIEKSKRVRRIFNIQRIDRSDFVREMNKNGNLLEIGPYNKPLVLGDNVKYFDVLDKNELSIRAKEEGRDSSRIPEIDFVSKNGDLSIINQKFDSIISSHCIEHQPDLILHLNQVSEILKDGGKYYVVIPDKRYCFDHFLQESSFENVISAIGRKTHTLLSVIEHRALTTHNDPVRHWSGDHADDGFVRSIQARTIAAIDEFETKKDGYIDVHAWQFTPDSFSRTIDILNNKGFISLKIIKIYVTNRNGIEFMAILKK